MKNIHMIWANPRADSLTAQIAARVKDRASAHGMSVRETDLYRLGFDPRLGEADEPDWHNPGKIYSPQVQQLASELSPNDLMIIIFPVWWYAMPAILKGYIDRVWNHGITYGAGSSPPAKKILWVALVGETEKGFIKRANDQHMAQHLNANVASFNGVKASEVLFLYNTIAEEVVDLTGHYHALIEQAEQALERHISAYILSP
ncbi:NAD(P)H oxidoreductase [Edwardsiella tarda]|uniref:NAD(P)H oxidoreductase n=1 Tax=Edwardsiella tarda TaxID=636 RepID=UPI00351C0E96